MKAMATAAAVAFAMAAPAAAQSAAFDFDEAAKVKALACFGAAFAALPGLGAETAGELAAVVLAYKEEFHALEMAIAFKGDLFESETCPGGIGRIVAEAWLQTKAKQDIERWGRRVSKRESR